MAEEGGRLLDATVAAVLRAEGDATTGRVVGAWTRAGAALAGAPLALNGGDAVSLATRTGRPASGRLPFPADRDGGGLALPIVVAGRPWGALAVAWERGEGSDAGARDLLARFAGLVGLAVANAETRSALATLASTDGRDRVLAEVGRRLASRARVGELIARAGGEEFGRILPQTDAAGALAAAERAPTAIAEEPFPVAGALTASAGVATSEGAHDASELFRAADAALYRAKEAGRDTSVLHAPGGRYRRRTAFVIRSASRRASRSAMVLRLS